MVANFTIMGTYGVNQAFRFLKAVSDIERVVLPNFFSEKTHFTTYVRNIFLATILYTYHASILGKFVSMRDREIAYSRLEIRRYPPPVTS